MEQCTSSSDCQKNVKPTKKPIYKDMVYRLSIHGALDLYESNTWFMKLMWAIVILVALVLALIEIYFTFDTYSKSPILTTYAVIPTNEMDFPQIYLCPMNSVNGNKIRSLNDINQVKSFFGMTKKWNDPNVILSKINRNYDNIRSETRLRSGFRYSINAIIEVFQKISMSESEFVKECAFHRKHIQCEGIVHRIFDGDYGQCFIISVNVSQKVPGYGLTLALDIRQDLYHPSITPEFDGLYLNVISAYDPGGSGDSIFVNPGGWTKISIHARHYKLINMDTGKVKQECVNDAQSRDYRILNYTNYSVASCKMDCAQKLCLSICDCVLPLDLAYLQRKYHKRVCSFFQLNNCFYMKVMKNHSDEISNCSALCVTKCDYWEYSKTTSFIGFRGDNSRDEAHVVNACNDSTECLEVTLAKEKKRLLTDSIILDISYSDLKYTQVMQSPSMTLDTLLGNIGGQAGLWLGVSVISLIQVFIVGICYVIERIRFKLA